MDIFLYTCKKLYCYCTCFVSLVISFIDEFINDSLFNFHCPIQNKTDTRYTNWLVCNIVNCNIYLRLMYL